MKLKTLSCLTVAIFAASCATANTPNYTVTLPLTEDEDDLMAYIFDYDTNEKVDSTIVTDGKAVFTGTVANPFIAQLIVDGSRQGTFILEPGNITVDPRTRKATGSALNESMNTLNDRLATLVAEYRQLPNDSNLQTRQQAVIQTYESTIDSAMKDNASNPLGLYLFLQKAYDLNLEQLDREMASNPAFASSKRLAKLRNSLLSAAETSEGAMFKDFAVTYNGETKRLSDYVGKGRYTLVDFWASWCGPCIRETAVVKDLYKKYGNKGLDVLGVAVWDDPANTLDAIKKHDIPWPQILNAQTIPTDIYGISGIPCIILFDPQGRIVSRNKQDQELINDVTAAMESAAATE